MDDLNGGRRCCLNFGDWRACVDLETDFWDCLESIAELHRVTVDELAHKVSIDVEAEDLAAALRVFVLTHFRGEGARSIDLDEGSVEGRSVTRLAFRQKYH